MAAPAGRGYGAGPLRRLASPMVGRERERRRLHDAFEQAVGDRSCQLFTVLGVAGVGKSRLVREFLDSVAAEALVARGRCLPYGEGITFWPLVEAVKDGVGLGDTASPDEARKRLLSAFGAEQGAEVAAQHVAEMIGLAEVAGTPEEGFIAVRGLFETAREHSISRSRLRRHPLGRAIVPRSPRAHRRLHARRPDPADLSGPAGVARHPPGLGRWQAECDLGPARAALGRRVRPPDREPGRSRRRAGAGGRDAHRRGGRGQPPLRRGDALDAHRRRSARPRGWPLGCNTRSRRSASAADDHRRFSLPASTGSTRWNAPSSSGLRSRGRRFTRGRSQSSRPSRCGRRSRRTSRR